MREETHWADDVSEYFPTGPLRDCYYCGSERTIGLHVGYNPICESCATLSKEERYEVLRNKDDQPIPYVLTNPEPSTPCHDPKYVRKVKITIEIDVPSDVESVALNHCGEIFGFPIGSDPKPVRYSWSLTHGYYRMLQIANWKETLTKVGE